MAATEPVDPIDPQTDTRGVLPSYQIRPLVHFGKDADVGYRLAPTEGRLDERISGARVILEQPYD